MNNIELILPSNWINEFKQLIRYPYNDIDANLTSYLNISITNIATQYLGLDEDAASQWFPVIVLEERVKLATFHLAATFYENPDILLTNSNGAIVDKNQIFRILGGLTKFYLAGKKPQGEEPSSKNVWEVIDLNTKNILTNTNDIVLLKTSMTALTNNSTKNTTDISNNLNDINLLKNDLQNYAYTKNGNVNFGNVERDSIVTFGNFFPDGVQSPLKLTTTYNGDSTDLIVFSTTGNLRMVSRLGFEFQARDIFTVNSKNFIFKPRNNQGTFNISNSILNGVKTPIEGTDGANKLYVDTLFASLPKNKSNQKKIFENYILMRTGEIINDTLNYFGLIIGVDLKTFMQYRGKIKSIWLKDNPLFKTQILNDFIDSEKNLLLLNTIIPKHWESEFSNQATIFLEIE